MISADKTFAVHKNIVPDIAYEKLPLQLRIWDMALAIPLIILGSQGQMNTQHSSPDT